MFVKVVVFLFNIFGVLNFRFNRKQKCFETRKVFTFCSVLVAIILQINMFYMLRGTYWLDDRDALLYLLGAVDLVTWETMVIAVMLDKIVQRKRYTMLMNQFLLLETESWKLFKNFSKFHKKFLNSVRLLGIFQLSIHTTYAVAEVVRDNFHSFSAVEIQQLIFAQTALFLIMSNLSVELIFVRGCQLNFDLLTSNVQNLSQLVNTLTMFDKILAVTKKLGNICQFVKFAQMCFGFVASTVYAFYFYYGFFEPDQSELLLYFWLFSSLFTVGSWTFWAKIFDKVSTLLNPIENCWPTSL